MSASPSPGQAGGFHSAGADSADLALPQSFLALPHESFAARQDQLYALRDGLRSLAADSPLATADVERIAVALDSYLAWVAEEFDPAHDHFRLVGEDNFRRYLPLAGVWIRIHGDDSPFDVLARAGAARAAGCQMVVSMPPNLPATMRRLIQILDDATDSWAAAIEFVEETDEELAAAMASGRIRRVRYAAPDRVPESIRRASAESYVYAADAPPVSHGRVELLWYVQEQSLTHVYHRYGNLGRRAEEERAPVA